MSTLTLGISGLVLTIAGYVFLALDLVLFGLVILTLGGVCLSVTIIQTVGWSRKRELQYWDHLDPGNQDKDNEFNHE